jgi:hypothetical protein
LAFHSGREATTHLRLVPRSKNGWELYLSSPNTPSWRGAQ